MENSTAGPLLGEEQRNTVASGGTFRGSTLRFVDRLGAMVGKEQQQRHAQQKKQQPQRLRTSLQENALNILTDAAKGIQQRGVYTEEHQKEEQLLPVLHDEQLAQRQQEEKKRQEEHQEEEQHTVQQQHQATDPQKTSQHQQGGQQSEKVAAGRRAGCTLLKSQDHARSGKGGATQSFPVASLTAASCSATPAGAATLAAETGRPAELGLSAETNVNTELYVSQELPIIYAHSVAFEEALPVGRLIPQNVRPPQCKAAAGLGPARLPPVLTGSPFFHCAPSSPKCPAVSPHTPALAALPQPLVVCDSSPLPSVYPPLFSPSSSDQNSSHAFAAGSPPIEQPVDAAAAGQNGARMSGLLGETIGNSATVVSAGAAAAPSAAAAEDPANTSGTTTSGRSPPPVHSTAGAARPSLPAAAAAAGTSRVCCATTCPETRRLPPAAAFAETAAAPAAPASAGLPTAAGSLGVVDHQLNGKEETQHRWHPLQRGAQESQQQEKPQREGTQSKGLKIITVPHQHAALYNYTIAALKRRLKETGQLSAICPSGIYLHEQLRSQQQPAFFAMLREVNKNAADAASLSKRWQHGYSRNCVGLPAVAAAKLKELQQKKKEAGARQSPRRSNDGSCPALSTTTSSSSSLAAASSSSSAAVDTNSPEHERGGKREEDAAKQEEGSSAAATPEQKGARGLDEKDDEQQTGDSAASTVSATPVASCVAAASTTAAGGSKSMGTLTIDDLVVKRGPPPSAAWIISGLPAAAAAASSAVQLQQQGQIENQLPPGAAADPADAAIEYQRLLSGRSTLQQFQEQQQRGYGGTALQLSDAAAALTEKQEAPAYFSREPGLYAGGSPTNSGGCAVAQFDEEAEAIAPSGMGVSRVYLLQQQLEAQEKKVKHLERMLAQHRAAYLATRPFAMKSLRLGPGRANGSSRQDYGHRRDSSCSSSGEAVAQLQERQNSETRSSSRNSGAFASMKADRGGDGIAVSAKTGYSGKHEKDDLDAQVRRFLSSRTSLPVDKVLRQVKRGVYIIGDTKALVTKERSGKIICEVLQHGGRVSDFAEEYKGKRLSLDRFWRLVCSRGICRNA